jgi:2-keto-4-pentenoate hydratase/2-oxohepta-3-ene-1,7-dioic acid hydratase in catechol pathway
MAQANNTIIALQQGLTLAHVIIDDQAHTVAVTHDNNGHIEGFDLTTILKKTGTPLSLYREFGYQKIRGLIEQADKKHYVTFNYDQLLSPAGEGSHHLALGLNYRKHADEVGKAQQPFMFIKSTKASREQDIPFDKNKLLDYEVEICARPIHPVSRENYKHAKFAFFLCADFTDRAILMRNIDHENIRTGKGFNRAKSSLGYFPTGPYLVIPHHLTMFLHNTHLSLSVNGQRRQNDSSKSMSWLLPQIMENLFALIDTNTPTYSETKAWLPAQKLRETTSILTGTPEGVILRPPNIWQKIKFGTWYFISLAFLSSEGSVRDYVVENFIDIQFAEKRFLQTTDKIVLSATHLGAIRLTIQ